MPQQIDIPGSKEPNSTVETTYDVSVYAKSPGNSEVYFNVTPAGFVRWVTIVILKYSVFCDSKILSFVIYEDYKTYPH